MRGLSYYDGTREGYRTLGRQEFAPPGALGFDPAELRPAESVTNQVWIAEDYVLKISSGRFRRALWHERQVLDLARHRNGVLRGSPFPVVRQYGTYGRSEWIRMSRADGQCLRDVWAVLSSAQRLDVMGQVGDVLRELHVLPGAGIEPPWLRDAIDRQDGRDIYHCPFEDYGALLASIPVDSEVVRYVPQMASYLERCRPAFTAARSRALVHADVHFGNLMWAGGKVTALLDFEGARSAPIDQELDTMLGQIWEPGRFGVSNCNHSEYDRDAMVSALLDSYPALFAERETNIRLAAYRIMTWLNEVHHYPQSTSMLDIPQISRQGDTQYRTYLLRLDIAEL